MASYVGDKVLRGNLPFPRARDDEFIYVLRKLLLLRVYPGSLWAALSEQPTAYAVSQPPVDASRRAFWHGAHLVLRSTILVV
uniref:Uncharacterized protein n=1 Tax=Mycena chlorophos TaxID=658473 RepID=A0ABQ0KUN5_MYCCL|nr:predicted protein [Mycena chlorophos]